MSIPKEPRQLMINLMYLVLTALLALNVSNEILNAFRTLSSSIDMSNQSIDQRNKEVYAAILENEKAPGQAEKVRPYREKADEVVKRSEEMAKYLDEWKKRIVMQAGGYSHEDPKFPDKMDDIDATTHLLVEKKGGDTLKRRIMEMRDFLLAQVSNPNQLSPLMPLKIDTVKANDHNPKGDWSIGNFEHMPAVAAMALFSKYQNDVRSSEALVVKQLFEEAHLKDIKFDTIGAVAIPNQSYALEGDKIEASIMLAAFNKAQRPEIKGMSGGGSTKPAVNGVIPWETIAKGTGLQTIKGTIVLQTETTPITRQWSFQYMVGTTGASMQLDKMNVFYIGVANPVTVAAAGYSIEDVSLEIPGAEVRGDSAGRKGHFNIWTGNTPGNVEVGIMAKTKDGAGKKKVGVFPVRVKRIPNPVAKLNGSMGGGMSAAVFRAQIAPAAILEAFEFDARFQIVAFSFSMLPKGKDFQGPFNVDNRAGCRFTDNKDIVNAMRNARAGDKIFIEAIKAVGPDKTPRNLNTLLFTLN